MGVAHVEGAERRWRRQEDGIGDTEMGSVMWRGWCGHGEVMRGDMEMFKVNKTWCWDMRRGHRDGGGEMEIVKTTWRWSKGHRKGERGDREELEVTMDHAGDHRGDP